MDGTGDLYPEKQQRKYYPMNQMVLSSYGIVVTIITSSLCHLDLIVACDM